MEKVYIVQGVIDHEFCFALKVFRNKEGAEKLRDERNAMGHFSKRPFHQDGQYIGLREDWCEIEEVDIE